MSIQTLCKNKVRKVISVNQFWVNYIGKLNKKFNIFLKTKFTKMIKH